MPTTIIRDATPLDLPALVTLWRALVAHHAGDGDPLWAVAPHAPETYAAFLRQQMGLRRAKVLVAQGPDGVDGYLVGAIGQRAAVWAQREIGMVFDLVVRPEARRGGVATRLLDAVSAFFAARSVTWVQVNYAPANAEAAGFWTARGFRPLLIEAYRAPGESC